MSEYVNYKQQQDSKMDILITDFVDEKKNRESVQSVDSNEFEPEDNPHQTPMSTSFVGVGVERIASESVVNDGIIETPMMDDPATVNIQPLSPVREMSKSSSGLFINRNEKRLDKWELNRINSMMAKMTRESCLILLILMILKWKSKTDWIYLIDTIYIIALLMGVKNDVLKYMPKEANYQSMIVASIKYFAEKPMNFLVYAHTSLFMIQLTFIKDDKNDEAKILQIIYNGFCVVAIFLTCVMFIRSNFITFVKLSYRVFTLILYAFMLFQSLFNHYELLVIGLSFSLFGSFQAIETTYIIKRLLLSRLTEFDPDDLKYDRIVIEDHRKLLFFYSSIIMTIIFIIKVIVWVFISPLLIIRYFCDLTLHKNDMTEKLKAWNYWPSMCCKNWLNFTYDNDTRHCSCPNNEHLLRYNFCGLNCVKVCLR